MATLDLVTASLYLPRIIRTKLGELCGAIPRFSRPINEIESQQASLLSTRSKGYEAYLICVLALLSPRQVNLTKLKIYKRTKWRFLYSNFISISLAENTAKFKIKT